LKISWQEHATNERVLKRIGMLRCLMNTITRRKTIWIGHVLRHVSEHVPEHAIEGRMEGKRTRGRKRMMLFDLMKNERGDNYQHLKTKALVRSLTKLSFFSIVDFFLEHLCSMLRLPSLLLKPLFLTDHAERHARHAIYIINFDSLSMFTSKHNNSKLNDFADEFLN